MSRTEHTPPQSPHRGASASSSDEGNQRRAHAVHTMRTMRSASIASLEVAVLALILIAVRRISVAIWRLPNGDVFEYHSYALAFWTQYPLFRSFPVEYPPLAIVPFSLTLVPPLADYQSVFTYWMGAFVLLGYLGVRRFAGRRRALAYFVYLVIGAAATVLERFDIFPALVTLAALWAAQRRRYTEAYLLLAVGVLLKLYPIFLLPLVAIEQWRTIGAPNMLQVFAQVPAARSIAGLPARLRAAIAAVWRSQEAWRVAEGMAVGLGGVAVGFLVALALNPAGALTGFTYANNRPLQVESTPATLLWLGTLVGIPAHADFSFVSLNYVGPLDVILKPLSAAALVAGCLWSYWRQALGKLTIGQAFIACLCAVLVTNKIFSPQYLIWVVPFVAAEEGVDLVWLIICALTTTIFPYLYGLRNPIQTVTFGWQFMPTVALRNLLLLYVTIRALTRSNAPAPATASDSQPALPAFAAPPTASETTPDEQTHGKIQTDETMPLPLEYAERPDMRIAPTGPILSDLE